MMPIDPTGLLIGGGISAGLSIYDRIRAEQARQEAMGYLSGLDASAPSADDLSVQYGTGAYTGDLSAVNLGDTALGAVRADPALEAAQLAALEQIQGVASNRGFTPADQARMQLAEARAAQQNRAAQEAVAANARARGIAGSGLEMMNRQIAQQGAAQDRALAGAQMTAAAGDRALQAMAQGGQMAGQMSDRQWGRAANTATARDAIARFNAANQQSVLERNLNARQQQANAAAEAANRTRASAAAARHQSWTNRANLAGQRAGIASGTASAFDRYSSNEAGDAGNWFYGAAQGM